MPRENSPYVVGDYWLDKRRDGKSPDIWQIATGTRQVKYRSTGCRSLDDAKVAIHAFDQEQRAKKPQEPSEARVIPLLLAYWGEKGKHAVAPAQIASSLRAFMGFLFQDEAGMNAVVTDLNQALFDRFRIWRMGPHVYDVPWGGKDYRHQSTGVKGESVQRNLDDVRAAINHAETNRRLPTVPKVHSVGKQFRSPPRDRVLSWQELGKIAWYARHFDDLGRYVALLVGTAARPIALAKFEPTQFDGRLIDLHPAASPQTDKRNPIIPAIRPLRLILSRWEGTEPVKTRRTAWKTMRAALGLSDDVVTKTVRHTLATLLYTDSAAPEREIAALLGHAPRISRTSERYIHLRPDHLSGAAKALSKIWLRVEREANQFGAVHLLSIHGKSGGKRVDKNTVECKDSCAFCGGGR